MKQSTRNIQFTIFLCILFTLTIGLSNAFAQLIVRAMPSGVASPVNAWDSKPYTWPSNALELWGNVTYDGDPADLTYTWDFGDGTAPATGTVNNADNIAVTHTFASEGTPIATLTVTDGTEIASATVNIAVVPKTFEAQKNLAIQRGLKRQYMTKQYWNQNGCETYYWDNEFGRWSAGTSLAVLAFEDFGHRASNDPQKDIYAGLVKAGLNAIFAGALYTEGASVNPPYDSDINKNNQRIYNDQGVNYDQGIIAMAIANTATPDEKVSSCGASNIVGMTYKDVLTDMVDWLAYSQNDGQYDASYTGGWRYGANSDSDNSVTQWPVLGMIAAEGAPFNITAPPFVKSRLINRIDSLQSTSGGCGYQWMWSWENIAKTACCVIGMEYASGGGSLANALSYISNQWVQQTNNGPYSDYGNIGDHYAMYAVKKGLQFAKQPTIGGHDWQQEYDQWFINNARDDGTNGYRWPPSMRIGYDEYYVPSYPQFANLPTSFALLVMAPGLVELPPVAVAGSNQEVFVGKPVSFDGNGSYHKDPVRHIVKYEWDFNYNGTTFNKSAEGVKVTNNGGYQITNGTDTQIYSIALRVTDDSTPARTAIGTTQITVTNGNVAPVANPGGPYICAAGTNLTLDGSKSYDPNDPAHCSGDSCNGDFIASYVWNFGGIAYGGVSPSIPCGSTIGTKSVSLTVTDKFGKTATQSTNSTTVAVSDLQPYCYKLISNTYNRITRKYTSTWQMRLQNKGNGAVSIANATLTGNTIPSGATCSDPNLAWNAGVGAGMTVLSNDTFSCSYAGTGPNLSTITWDFTFTDALGGGQHFVGSVPQGNLMCQ